MLLGAWTVGVIADYVSHFNSQIPSPPHDIALAVGLAVGVLAILTGYTDFHETVGLERRFAVVHGLTVTVVCAVDGASLGLLVGLRRIRIRSRSGFRPARGLC